MAPAEPLTPRALLVDPEEGFVAELQAQPGMGLCRLDGAAGGAEALRRLRSLSYDVVLTSPRSPIPEDLALLSEMRVVRPGVKAIVLAPGATAADVIATLRAQAFACFVAPFPMAEVAEMVRRAVQNPDWRDGLQLLSARANYVRDPGPGFSLDDLPHAAVGNPPDDPLAHAAHRERLGLRPGGFGLLLARGVVDELLHSEKANEVLLIKHTA